VSDSGAVLIPRTKGWATVNRPGYLGAKRNTLEAGFDEEYGVGGWRLAWAVGEVMTIRSGMNMLYEDAYFAYLDSNRDVLKRLAEQACEVYDDEISNVGSGLDYTIQETPRTHVQDIAIRRCMVRFGVAFKGSELIRIRHDLGTHELSMVLSPGHVPFHRPELIVDEIEGWWGGGSVEAFYQSNKFLQVKTCALEEDE